MIRRSSIFLLLLFTTITGLARVIGPGEQRPEHLERDSLDIVITERNQRLYDSIQSKTKRRAVSRILYDLFFTQSGNDSALNGRVQDESQSLKGCDGKTIGSIAIERNQVFAPDGNWFERLGNKTHMLTRERVIRRDLLFRAGDRFDAELVVRNLQLLRSRSYIADAGIRVRPDSLDSTRVDLVIRTRDSWTITLDAALRSKGRTMVGLYDANILGSGNLLKLKTNFDRQDFSFGGSMVEYEIPNLFGSFFTANLSGGHDFYETDLSFGLRKEFLRPTDYEVGITYSDIKSKHYLIDRDTSVLAKVRRLDLWGGRSLYLPGLRSSLFLTGRYSYARFSQRPRVAAEYHPAFHDHDMMLFGAGFYREKFYATSMIYGFGTKEYLAAGYKAELVGGYSWGEFNDEMYLGVSYKSGRFRSFGYLMGSATLGSYIDLATGTWRHSAVDLRLQWFSNLFLVRRNRIRQFLELNYTQGWNRAAGANESLRFTDSKGLQGFKEHVIGTNRLALNSETVLFTPFQPLGFRIAFFGFADFGLIGYSSNIFRNDFFTTLGLGIRIKNERLIFSAIQIRLGVALGKHGLVDCDYFDISNSTRLERVRYRPTRPETVEFE